MLYNTSGCWAQCNQPKKLDFLTFVCLLKGFGESWSWFMLTLGYQFKPWHYTDLYPNPVANNHKKYKELKISFLYMNICLPYYSYFTKPVISLKIMPYKCWFLSLFLWCLVNIGTKDLPYLYVHAMTYNTLLKK